MFNRLKLAFFCLSLFSSMLHANQSCLDESSVYSGLTGINNPSTQDIMRLGQLGGNLCPTKPQPQTEISSRSANPNAHDDTAEQNQQFGEAMELWNQHNYKEAYHKLDAYTRSHPNGLWAGEAKLHMGCDARFNGRYRESDQHFSEIIKQYSNNQDFGSKRIVNKARSRLAVQRVLENNPEGAKQEFSKLLNTTHDWRLKTYAQHWLQRINKMEHQAQGLADCGYKALEQVLLKQGKTLKLPKNKAITKETKGQTLSELQSLAKQHGLKLQPLKASIKDIQLFPTPFIVQIDRSYSGGAGHYWLVEKVKNKQVQIYDAQSARRFTQSTQEFAKEWQGYALVFDTQNKWQNLALSQQQAEEVMGGCCGIQRPEGNLGAPSNSNEALAEEGGLDECSGSGKGCPTWSVNPKNMNIYITDTPLWYQPAYGPEVKIKLSYNSQSALARNEIFAGKWSFNYGSYIVEDPGGSATVFMPDGGRISFPSDGNGGFGQAYNVVAKLVKKSAMHYELTLKNDQTYVYSQPQGTSSQQVFLTKLKDAQGHSLSFHYNSKVQLISIEDAQGRHTRLTYNQDGFVTKATDPFGRNAYFGYSQDAKSRRKLTSITDMGGFKSELSYDENLYPKTIKKPYGTWNFHVEPSTRRGLDTPYPPPNAGMWQNYRITITTPKGHKEEYYYNGYDGYSWYVSPNNYIEYGSSSNLNASKKQWRYTNRGSTGKISSVNGYGVSGTFAYDSKGRITRKTNIEGLITNYVYNQFGQKIQIKKNNKLIQSFTYLSPDKDTISSIKDYVGENQTRLTEFSYDEYNNITKKSISVIEEPNSGKREWTYQYNANHQLIKIDGPREDVADISTFSYYSCTGSSNLADCGQLHTSTNALGHITTYTNYHASGKPQKITDPNGLITLYYYDLLGRVTRSEQTDGNSKRAIGYKYAGVMNRVSQVNLPNGEQLNYEYNSDKQLIKLTNNYGDVLELVRDKNGNITQRNLKDSSGQLVKTAQLVYNQQNQLIKQIDSKQNATSFSYYNGRIRNKTDAAGATTNYSFDKRGNLIRADGMAFGYSQADILTHVTDRKNLKTNYKYNGFGERIERISPDTGTTTYGYDKAGNQIHIKNALGVTTQLKYDALNRLIQVIRTPNPDAKDNKKTEQTDYSWDGNKKGYLNQIRFDTGSTTYQYNGFGELIQQAQTTNGKTYTTQYHYNDKGELIGQDYPSTNGIQGAKVRYTYQTGRISKIDLLHQGNTLSLASNIEYFPFSGIKSYQLGNGIQYQQQRDQDGLITAYQYTGRQHSDWAKYAYNSISQIEQIQKANKTNNLSYNRWKHLTKQGNNSSDEIIHKYNFDDQASKESKSLNLNNRYQYPRENHGLIKINTDTIIRDAMGNLIKDAANTYTYGVNNRLFKVSSSVQIEGKQTDLSMQYLYHPLGYRISKEGILASYGASIVSRLKKLDSGLQKKQNEQAQKQTLKQQQLAEIKQLELNIPRYQYLLNMQEEYYKDNDLKIQKEIKKLQSDLTKAEQLLEKRQQVQSQARRDFEKAEDTYRKTKQGWNKLVTFNKVLQTGITLSNAMIALEAAQLKANRLSTALYAERHKYQRLMSSLKHSREYVAKEKQFKQTLTTSVNTLTQELATLKTSIANMVTSISLLEEQIKNKQPQIVHSLYGGNRTHNQYWPISQITYEGNKTHSQQYIYLYGRPIALLQTKATGQSDIYYYQNNHLNAPLKLTDKNQNSVWQAEQKGFEFVVNQQDVVQPLRFPGQIEDTETGFYYNYHRYYNPKIGRYTQPDPIGLAGGINPYVYANNNPIMNVDPSGEFVPQLLGFVIGAGLEYLTNPCATTSDILLSGGLGAIGGGLGKIGLLRYGPKSLTRVHGKEWSHAISKKMVNKYTSGSLNKLLNKRGGLNGSWVSPKRHYKHDAYRHPRGWGQFGRRYPSPLKTLDRIPDWAKASTASGVVGSTVTGMQNDCECQQ